MHGQMQTHCGCRQFLTKEEKIEMLEQYKKLLDSESKGVGEAIADLKETKDK